MKENINRITRKYDNALYLTMRRNRGALAAKWGEISSNPAVLEKAIEVTKNMIKEDVFCAPLITEMMLRYSEDVPFEIYQILIDKIFSNKNLARFTQISSYPGVSFLTGALQNNSIILTAQQKEFAEREANNRQGTTVYKNMIREAQESMEINSRDHGTNPFDIRYWILRNPNFTSEFTRLVYSFWANDEDYKKMIEALRSRFDYRCFDEEGAPLSIEDITKFNIKLIPYDVAELDLIKKMLNIRNPKTLKDDYPNIQKPVTK